MISTKIPSEIYKKVIYTNQIKSVFANEYSIDKISIRFEDYDINQQTLMDDEVLILTDSCPINPLDLLKISGKINTLKLPYVLGSECSGIVVKTSDKNVNLIGRKVAALIQSGSYKSINITKDIYCIPFPDEMNVEELCSGFVNPVTSLGLISYVSQFGAKAIVNTAAASALGKMIIKLCEFNKLPCINIVRSEKSESYLKSEFGNDTIVLNSTKDNFIESLILKTNSLNATLCFDCVGGNLTGTILNNMPNNSTSIIYGSLESDYLSNVNGILLRGKNQGIRGFSLFNWWLGLTEQEREKLRKFIADNINTLFKTTVAKFESIDNVKNCIREYQNNMSEGKHILKF